jgi:hypothetical protein
VLDARRALLGRLIDHAPLFPPTSLPVEEAVAEDRRFRGGPHGWLVGRFVCPASKLAEVGEVGAPLSVVMDEPVSSWPADAQVEAVETSNTVLLSSGSAPKEVYVEGVAPEELAGTAFRAKIRCGGASVPSVDALAEFVTQCRELGIPFKATAGLHHAVRVDGQHGFLNLIAAALFEDASAFEEEDPVAFCLDTERFRWRDRSAGADELAAFRRDMFVGFGSCSAQEPADELAALGFLP